MSAYGLVPAALQETGKTFRDILSHEATGRVSRAKMGLAKAEQSYNIKQAEYEKFMNTPDTAENIVNNFPGMSPEQKQRFLNAPQYKLLHEAGIVTTPAQIVNAMNKVREEKAKRTREDEVSRREFKEKLITGGKHTPQSIEDYIKSITSETPRGNFGLLKRIKEEPSKVWVHNPEKSIKRQVFPTEADILVSRGWQRGQAYSDTGTLETRLNKRQELISLRQDKANLKRQISKIKALPDLDIYRSQKADVSLLEDELNDLVDREDQLLGKNIEEPEPENTEGLQTEFKTPDEVRSAFQAGTINQQKALEILKTQFGME